VLEKVSDLMIGVKIEFSDVGRVEVCQIGLGWNSGGKFTSWRFVSRCCGILIHVSLGVAI